jgi:hypothetical protein
MQSVKCFFSSHSFAGWSLEHNKLELNLAPWKHNDFLMNMNLNFSLTCSLPHLCLYTRLRAHTYEPFTYYAHTHSVYMKDSYASCHNRFVYFAVIIFFCCCHKNVKEYERKKSMFGLEYAAMLKIFFFLQNSRVSSQS